MTRFVFDLDGTICSGKPYETASPVKRIVRIMRRIKERGDYIIIHTARGMKTYDGDVTKVIKNHRTNTKSWLKKYNVPYDELVFGKPAGDIYVDDKAINVKDFHDWGEKFP